MTGEPVKLHFKEDAKPHVLHTPITIPHHWKEQVKDDASTSLKKYLRGQFQRSVQEWL